MGAEIWIKIDGAILGSAAPRGVRSVRRRKNGHYMIRWRMQDGSVCGWGETVSATITA